MDILHETRERKSFFSHVFSTTEEGKSEVFNVLQYASLGIIPIVVLNKLIQRFIPESDTDKSSIEILVEIFIQLIVMFCGIIVIHRIITFVPTYSGIKYDHLMLTNVILAFLVLVLSIQTKLGIKVNILVDRLAELWNGPENAKRGNGKRGSGSGGQHSPSQADFLDESSHIFPPIVPPSSPSAPPQKQMMMMEPGPMAANGVLGGSGFGTFF